MSFCASQILSSERLLSFFYAANFKLKSSDNLKLYFVGMFYNFFIPGGIGGDAYKVFILNKRFHWNVKKLSAAVLCDRISGLLAILILLQLISIYFLSGWFLVLPLLAIPLMIIISKIVLDRFFYSFKTVFQKGLVFSLGVQLLQVLAIFFILKSFSEVSDFWIYAGIFLASSVLSLISFSGIGVREWLFMKASQYFGFNPEVSVSAALLFSFMTALVSLIGVFYQWKGMPFATEKESV